MKKAMKSKSEILSLLTSYKATAAKRYGVTRIGIFGSVARGEQTENSDVDVCVGLKEPKLFTLVHIREELKELFGRPVDVVRLRDDMDQLLLRNINRDGVYV